MAALRCAPLGTCCWICTMNGCARPRRSLSRIACSPTTATTRSTTVACADAAQTSAAAHAPNRQIAGIFRIFMPLEPHVVAIGHRDEVVARPVPVIGRLHHLHAVRLVDVIGQLADDAHERTRREA